MNVSQASDVEPKATATIVSDIPGRLRVRLDRTPHLLQMLDEAWHRIKRQPGVGHVERNGATRSLLLRYDAEQLNKDQVLGILRDAGVIVRDVAESDSIELPDAGKSVTATTITEALNDLDRRLSSITGRRVDLKLLIPAVMGALGLRQTLTHGLGLNQVPGYVLLWYAFDSFWKFHSPRSAAEPRGDNSSQPSEPPPSNASQPTSPGAEDG